MNKIGSFLFATVLLLGVSGCEGGSDESFTPQEIAGVYQFTKFSLTSEGYTASFQPPDISGTLTLTSAGTYDWYIVYMGLPARSSGRYVVSDATIVFTESGSSTSEVGTISDGGRRIVVTAGDEDTGKGSLEFTRS